MLIIDGNLIVLMYNNKTINIIRSKLNIIFNQTIQDINELVRQYNRQKNEIKKEENNRIPLSFNYCQQKLSCFVILV